MICEEETDEQLLEYALACLLPEGHSHWELFTDAQRSYRVAIHLSSLGNNWDALEFLVVGLDAKNVLLDDGTPIPKDNWYRARAEGRLQPVPCHCGEVQHRTMAEMARKEKAGARTASAMSTACAMRTVGIHGLSGT